MQRFTIPPDKRASLLLEEFDERYFSFVGELPEPLQEFAIRRKTYLGQEIKDPFEGFTSINPLYTCTPWMLWELFSELPSNRFIALAVSGGFLSLASILMDHLVDDQLREIANTMLLYHALYDRAQQGFRRELGTEHRFWEHFDRLTAIYLRGMSLETEIQAARIDFDKSKFKMIAASKVAPIMIAISSFCIAADRADCIARIERSINGISMAGQMLDDVLDWERDQQDGHLTYLLAEVSTEYRNRSPNSDISFADYMKTGPHLVHAIGDAIRWFDQAEADMREIASPGWQRYIEYYRNIALEEKRRRIARIVLEKITAFAE